MRAVLCLFLLCLAVGTARGELDTDASLQLMHEIEEILAVAFWNATLTNLGQSPEEVATFLASRATLKDAPLGLLKAGADAIQAEVQSDLKLHETKLSDAYREAMGEVLKQFPDITAALGQAMADHEGRKDALQRFHDTQAQWNTKLAGYAERLARAAVGLPEFEPPSGEAEFAALHADYARQSAANQERFEKARQQTEEALRRAKEGQDASDAAAQELRASSAQLNAAKARHLERRTRKTQPGEVNAVAQ